MLLSALYALEQMSWPMERSHVTCESVINSAYIPGAESGSQGGSHSGCLRCIVSWYVSALRIDFENGLCNLKILT